MDNSDEYVHQVLVFGRCEIVQLSDDDVDDDLHVVEVHQAVGLIVEKYKVYELHNEDLINMIFNTVEIQ